MRKELKNVMKLFEPKLTPATDVMKDLSHLSRGSGAELVSFAFQSGVTIGLFIDAYKLN